MYLQKGFASPRQCRSNNMDMYSRVKPPGIGPSYCPGYIPSTCSLCRNQLFHFYLPSHYTTMTQKIFDTILIGAGWTSAAAARELTAKGHSVLVLEARDRVGGRARTWSKDGVKIDVGCSWIHGYKEGNPTRVIAKDLGVTAHLPKPADGVIYGPDGRSS
jgi:hypothetical protein